MAESPEWRVEENCGREWVIVGPDGIPVWYDLTEQEARTMAASRELLAAVNGFRFLGKNLDRARDDSGLWFSLFRRALEDAEDAAVKAGERSLT